MLSWGVLLQATALLRQTRTQVSTTDDRLNWINSVQEVYANTRD